MNIQEATERVLALIDAIERWPASPDRERLLDSLAESLAWLGDMGRAE